MLCFYLKKTYLVESLNKKISKSLKSPLGLNEHFLSQIFSHDMFQSYDVRLQEGEMFKTPDRLYFHKGFLSLPDSIFLTRMWVCGYLLDY